MNVKLSNFPIGKVVFPR